MKREKRKIAILLLLMFLTAVLLNTSTYAWFSANRRVTIETLNIQVATQGGIDISTDAINWKNTVSLEDLDKAYETYPTSVNLTRILLEPVSSGGHVDTSTGYLKIYHGAPINVPGAEDYYLTTKRTIEEREYVMSGKGDFIVFDIFLKTVGAKELYLSDASGITYTGENSVGTENAFRIAFVIEGTGNIDGNIESIQKLKNATNDTVYIWEPNYDTHTDAGIENALNVYGRTITNINSNRLPYDGVIAEIGREDEILLQEADSNHYPSKFKKMNVNYATRKNSTSYTRVFDLDAGITKVRVYVWLEGQDVDCENKAAVGNVDFSLQLTTDPS